LRCVVPWPPTANHCFVTTRTGRRVLTRSALQYRAQAQKLVQHERVQAAFVVPADAFVVVEAWYYKPDRRRRDTDNVRKVLADAVAQALDCDDSQFLWRDMAMRFDRERPRVELLLYAQGPEG
jgi:Holliday junction resolvase RusA-like endonuclease